jgi:hypothetical protein
MKLLTKAILLSASIGIFGLGTGVFAQTSTQSAETFLPKAPVTDAVYVQIDDDPALVDYGRRIREARAKNPEWFLEYGRKHQKPGLAPVPYHPNFGVSRQEYEHFSQAKNHFREMKQKPIQIRRSVHRGYLQFDFQGEDLLLTQVVLNLQDGTAKTPTDVLPKETFVDLETASLPPDRHRGVLFRTPDAKIAASKRRESLLIGELKDKKSGIIHYAINTPGEVKRIYIQFPK